MFFQLSWVQHGGSGLNVTIGEIERMRGADILWYLERVNRARREEAAALKAASKPKRKGK